MKSIINSLPFVAKVSWKRDDWVNQRASEPGTNTAAGCGFSSLEGPGRTSAAEERQESLPAPRGTERGGVSVGPVVRLSVRIVQVCVSDGLSAGFWKFHRSGWTSADRRAARWAQVSPTRIPLSPFFHVSNLSRAAAAAGRKERVWARRVWQRRARLASQIWAF